MLDQLVDLRSVFLVLLQALLDKIDAGAFIPHFLQVDEAWLVK